MVAMGLPKLIVHHWSQLIDQRGQKKPWRMQSMLRPKLLWVQGREWQKT
jgi:hypothetical protein